MIRMQQQLETESVGLKATSVHHTTGTLPTHAKSNRVSYKAISKDACRHTVSASSLVLAENTVNLVIGIKVVADPTDPTEPEDVEGLIVEVRDFSL